MKIQHATIIVFLITFCMIAVPLTKAATTLAAPTVSVPNNNWSLTDSTIYPNSYGEHDPDGAGMLEYTDQTNYDVVKIYYEKAQATNYTSSQLKSEAEDLFDAYDSTDSRPLNSSGTANYAGVSAGFAKGYDDTDNTFKMEIVFIKGEYYFNVHAYYDDTTQSKSNVDSIVNSIGISDISGEPTSTPHPTSALTPTPNATSAPTTTPNITSTPTAATTTTPNVTPTTTAKHSSTPLPTNKVTETSSSVPWLFVIIGIGAAVAVIVVIVVVLVTRSRKNAQPQAQYGYPPPPPPPTQ